MIATKGSPFHDDQADDALISAIKVSLDDRVELRELDTDINDEEFALAMADTLVGQITSGRDRVGTDG